MAPPYSFEKTVFLAWQSVAVIQVLYFAVLFFSFLFFLFLGVTEQGWLLDSPVLIFNKTCRVFQ